MLYSQVVAHENLTTTRREEIYSMLLEMDELFGGTKAKILAFSLYGPFDSNSSIIFPVREKINIKSLSVI